MLNKFYKLNVLIILLLTNSQLVSQCSFDLISLFDNCEEDFMELFEAKGNSIIAIGIKQNRIGVNPLECKNGFFFRKFDYCGNVLNDRVYGNWDSLEYRESNYTGLVEITATDFSQAGYNVVSKNTDSYFMGQIYDEFKYSHIFLVLDSDGNIKFQKIFSNNQIEGYIKNLIRYDNERFIAISIFENEQYMYWLNSKGELLKNVKIEKLEGGGLYFSAVTTDKQLCFTGYKDFTPIGDANSLFITKIDTFGNINWTYSASKNIGSGRDIFVTDSSIIICALRYDSLLGNDAIILLELDNSGIELSRRVIDVPGYKLRAYNVSITKSMNSGYFIVASLNPTYNNNTNTSMSVVALNNNLEYKWHKYFFNKDHTSFGQKIIEVSDGDLVMIGKIRRRSPNAFGSRIIKFKNQDAVGIHEEVETKEGLILFPNPAKQEIYFSNYINQPLNYVIFAYNGQNIQSGRTLDRIEISKLTPGLYLLQLINKFGIKDLIKFIKE